MKWFVALVVACAGLGGVSGCAQHDDPLGVTTVQQRDPFMETFGFTNELKRNSANDRVSRQVIVAYASDQPLNVQQQPFPVLYLLHDFDGDAGYFLRYGLQALLDDMYSKGEIGRMLVVMVDASNVFGGSYYRNADSTTMYEEVITELINHMEAPGSAYKVYTQAGPGARAISGHGMGGYGALRYALDHPQVFSSISSLSGMLSIGDPSIPSGVWKDLVPNVMTESGVAAGDTSLYTQIRLHADQPNTRMFLAMSSAFSPHPLRILDSVGCLRYKDPFRPIWYTICPWDFFSPLASGPRTIKFPGADTNGFGVDMIFDRTGQPDPAVWRLWHDSADVKTVFVNRRASNPTLFQDMPIYMDVGEDDELGYLEQNREFDAALTAAGVAHDYEEYSGASGISAGHSKLLMTRLRKIIKFHDQYLQRPPGL